MFSELKLQPTPFRFLLYTEWVLLGSCGTLAIIEAFEKGAIQVQHTLILFALWGLGLVLPTGNHISKIIYTALEIGLIFYGAMRGYLHILPMLYLIVVIRACFLFAPSGRWTIAGIVFTLFLGHQVRYVQSITRLVNVDYQQRFWMHLIGETLMFGLALFLVLKLANALLSERELRSELEITHNQLQQYAQKDKELAAAIERNRIARNIHDSLGHVLSALNAQLQAAVELWRNQYSAERIQPFLEQAHQLGMDAMAEVRNSVRALYDQKQLPLNEAIAELVDRFQSGTGISVELSIDVRETLPAATSEAVYRVVQEALTNIHKHAQATAVEVRIQSSFNAIEARIIDNGCGFRHRDSTGFGLPGMQGRVAALDGILEVMTEPGQGCQITIKLPLRGRNDDSVIVSR